MLQITWIDLDKTDKNGKANPLCRIGEDNESALFYRCDKVKAFMKNMKKGDYIDEGTFKFEKKKIGNFETSFITFIKLADDAEIDEPTKTTSTANTHVVTKSFDSDLSRKQTCANVAGQLMRSLQGQVTPEDMIATFKGYYKDILEILES